MISDTSLKFWGAIAAALASLVVAVITHLSTRANQRAIEQMKGDIADTNAERDAKRDYQYEARKRLYEQCGPLLFQLAEASEGGYYRVLSLASRAREGNLGPDRPSYLSHSYYRLATLYRLFAPAAVLKLIQQRLTLVDLSLDRAIHRQYTLARQAFFAFGDEFTFAQLAGLPYEPFADNAKTRARAEPARYGRQGLPLGIIEGVLEALLVPAEGRILSYAECEDESSEPGSRARAKLDDVSFLVDNFHPATKPVFWLMLVSQACVYRTLSHPYDLDDPKWSWRKLTDFSVAERTALEWGATAGDPSDGAATDPIAVADRYFRETLAPRLERVESLYAAQAKGASP